MPINEERQALLEEDPGNPQFVIIAEELRLAGEHADALFCLLRGISYSPSNHQARLLLARVFYECDCIPYALSELTILCRELPEHEHLHKLYRALGGSGEIRSAERVNDQVLAESEIDFDLIEELDQENH